MPSPSSPSGPEATGVLSLPIDPLVTGIVATLRDEGRLVVQAEPGAGKTTRIPPALMEAFAEEGEIWVLEPRRIAARLAAARVALELGEKLGERVGYIVKNDQVGGPRTRLRFMTEGVLARRFIEDRRLARAAVLVLDEFHERSLQGDLALALAKELRAGPRPELRILVMSATLETEAVSAHLGGATVVHSEGRCFPVSITYDEGSTNQPFPERVARAVRIAIREESAGDVLVFLPGAAEIRRCRDSLSTFARERGLDLLMLHGSLPAAEQDRAVAAGPRRKIVLATNVAETSITLPSVTTVIDGGLARIATHSPWSGLSSLEVRPIAKSSAKQRAGRAGRVAPGRCVRIYDRHELERRPESERPEILRADLCELVLSLAAAGVADPACLPWLDPPPQAALDAAGALLSRLGAIDAEGRITEVGLEMARMPVHPRQARLLVEARRLGVFAPACTIAAIAAERDVLARGPEIQREPGRVAGTCDLQDRLERLLDIDFKGTGGPRLRGHGLDPAAARAVEKAAARLRRIEGVKEPRQELTLGDEDALRRAVLAGWPDRVARRRRPGGEELLMAEGGEARLSRASVVQEAEWMVAVDASVLPGGTLVHLATAIEPEWLVDYFPDRVEERTEVTWNQKARRVEAFSRMVFGNAVLVESRERAADRPEAWRLLADEALRMGVDAYADADDVANIAGRLRVAAEAEPEGGYPILDDETLTAAIVRMCHGRSRFDELSSGALLESILQPLSFQARARLEVLAPTHVSLPGRRRAKVAYPADAAPFVASRIQDFFGLEDAPRIGAGRVSLVVHLLAPNNRPVQITGDLSGFWLRHYPTVRKELCRRYPRHSWPEDPPKGLK